MIMKSEVKKEYYYTKENIELFLKRTREVQKQYDFYWLAVEVFEGFREEGSANPTPVLNGDAAKQFNANINQGEVSDKQKGFLKECDTLLSESFVKPKKEIEVIKSMAKQLKSKNLEIQHLQFLLEKVSGQSAVDRYEAAWNDYKDVYLDE